MDYAEWQSVYIGISLVFADTESSRLFVRSGFLLTFEKDVSEETNNPHYKLTAIVP